MTNKIDTTKLLPRFEDLFNSKSMKSFLLRAEAIELSRNISDANNLCIFVGSSGAGRDTILDSCLEMLVKAKRIKRTTTRQSREDVKDPERLNFIEEEVFLKSFSEGEVLFAGRYHVNQRLYGISRTEICKIAEEQETFYLLEENFSGLPIKALFPSSKLIVVLPPSFEILKQRLLGREKNSQESQKRYETSITEIKTVISNLSDMINDGFVDMVVINEGNPKIIAQRIVEALKRGEKLVDDYSKLAAFT